MQFDATAVGAIHESPVETMPNFVRGTTVLYSLPPRGNPQADAGDREAVEGACVTKGLRHSHRNAFSPTRLRREPSAPVASVACFPLWLKICHRHIFLTRRAHPEGASRNAETMPHFVRYIVHVCVMCTNMRGGLCKMENLKFSVDNLRKAC